MEENVKLEDSPLIESDENSQIENETTLEVEGKEAAEINVESLPDREPIKMKRNLYSCFFKRFFDIILSFILIIVLSPLLLILTILVRVKLGSPVIFSQYRPGKNEKIFKFIKFRSMVNAKDKNGHLLPDKDRMTKFGKVLRASSMDELPQLFCILIGQMSFIGPRPRMVEECVFLSDDQKSRFLVRPGITGLAQINGRNDITFDKVIEYDKQYIQNLSFWQDVKIFFKTFGKVFKREGVNKKGTVSNEFYGDYLLSSNKISKEEYDIKHEEADEIIRKAS